MVEAARTVRDGGPAIGAGPDRIPHANLASFEGIVPKSTDWKALNVSPEELERERAGAP